MGGRGTAVERRRGGAAVKSEKRKVKSGAVGRGVPAEPKRFAGQWRDEVRGRGRVLNARGADMGWEKGTMA